MASQKKIIFALALVLAIVCVNAQDYDDEGGNQGNDGYGGFSGGGGDDDYAAPRERGVVGAEGSDINPGYQQGDEGAGSDSYDNDDSAAAASEQKPTLARANLMKLIKRVN